MPLNINYDTTTSLSNIYDTTTPLSDIYDKVAPLSDANDEEWGLEEIIEVKKEAKVVDSYLTHKEFEVDCLLGWIQYPFSLIRSIISKR